MHYRPTQGALRDSSRTSPRIPYSWHLSIMIGLHQIPRREASHRYGLREDEMKILLLIAIGLSASCQEDLQKVRIQGQVNDADGNAIAEADVARYWSVYDSSAKDGVKTNKDGSFVIEVQIPKRS